MRGPPPVLLAHVLVLPVAACAPEPGDPLEPGPVHVVSWDPRSEVGPLYRIEVPEEATALLVEATAASHDVELYARWEDPPLPEEGVYDAVAADAFLDERLLVDVTDGLWPGTWYVAVALGAEVDRSSDEPVLVDLRATLVEPPVVPLAPDGPTELVLAWEHGLRAAVRVPRPAEGPLVLEAHAPLADVDLVLGAHPDGRTWHHPLASSATFLGYERLRVPLDELPEGPLFLHVHGYPSSEGLDRVPVAVLASAGPGANGSLCPEPLVPAVGGDLGPLERAVRATVAVFGPLGAGSGVVVSPAGHVLTNAHVVAGRPDPDAEVAPYAVGFTTRLDRPPVASLGCELLEVREDLDLALLRIATRLDGTPVAPGLELPHLPLAADGQPPLALGSPVTVLGYPMTGGSGSMVTITVTRGVVAGYAPEAEGALYKTDAAVHSGVSGGACVDARGRLVGLPSASIRDANEAGGLGLVLPVELVPPSWRRRLAR